MTKSTHFGYEQVPEDEKAKRVGAVFSSVAGNYDLMNDLMSMGLHRLWKRFTLAVAAVRPGERVLDVASGSGDLALGFARRAGPAGMVCMTDINAPMLGVGRDKLVDAGVAAPAVQCDAEKLPFPDATFDLACVGFGLRNMTHKEQALAEMARVTRPGGRVLVLEFSKPWKPLTPAYDAYSFSILPKLGKYIARDEPAYRYLAESIRMHPDQETLKGMMEGAGLERVEYFNLAAGIVALHRGWRL